MCIYIYLYICIYTCRPPARAPPPSAVGGPAPPSALFRVSALFGVSSYGDVLVSGLCNKRSSRATLAPSA